MIVKQVKERTRRKEKGKMYSQEEKTPNQQKIQQMKVNSYCTRSTLCPTK